MTAVIDNYEPTNTFLTKLLYPRSEVLSTESAELSTLEKGRQMAPFVLKNGEAVHVDGGTDTFAIVETPYIRIKRTMDAASMAFRRAPGGGVFVTGRQAQQSVQQAVARDMKLMADYIANTKEWLVSQALIGTITYTDLTDQDKFTVTYPRPAANSDALASTAQWDHLSYDGDLEADFFDAKHVLNASPSGATPTDCIMDAVTAKWFLKRAKATKLLETNMLLAGSITFMEQFSKDAVIYMGNFSGVRCWAYSRTITDMAGAIVPMIRAKFVEFIDANSIDTNVMYYGAIPEVDDNGNIVVLTQESFAKGWITKDPASVTGLVATRPLPVPRQPSNTYSLQVLA